MVNQAQDKLTLDRKATYRIKVPGKLDESWMDWVGDMVITTEADSVGLPITILTGKFDQAALQGILRRLYSLGLPLISVVCIEISFEE